MIELVSQARTFARVTGAVFLHDRESLEKGRPLAAHWGRVNFLGRCVQESPVR